MSENTGADPTYSRLREAELALQQAIDTLEFVRDVVMNAEAGGGNESWPRTDAVDIAIRRGKKALNVRD